MKKNLLKSDLKNIQNWVFDLDDTLYPSSEEIFGQMSDRIRDFIVQSLQVSPEKATEIQKEYYKKYGATVRGLMLEYQIRPEDFTDYVHELDLSSLEENKQLEKYISKLPGNKYVFTNGAYHHAERVLDRVGIKDKFEGIFSIREAGYIPKPAKETYFKMMETFAITPETSIMFDDSQVNLRTAHELGLKTVWISANVRDNKYNKVSDNPAFCDYQTGDLVSFLSTLMTE